MLVRRDDAREQPFPARSSDDDVDDEADREPGRAGVARARVCRERDDPDSKREHRADHRGNRHAADGQRHAVGAPPVGLAEAQPDHSELRGGECEQHAETEEAREEENRMREDRCPSQQEDRDSGSRHDRLRRDEGALPQHSELPR